MHLKDLQTAAYKQAVEKGLYNAPQSISSLLGHIREEGREALNAWKQFRDLQNHFACTSRHIEECLKVDFKCPECPRRRNEGVPQELADVVIMTCSAAEYLGIDLEREIKIKMEYNAIRER